MESLTSDAFLVGERGDLEETPGGDMHVSVSGPYLDLRQLRKSSKRQAGKCEH